MKILIPGGHLTPALGLIDWIIEHQPEVEIIFVGREFTQEKLKQKAIEFEEVSKRGVDFIPFKTSKSPRFFPLSPIIGWQLLRSTHRSIKLIKQHKPTVVMSFGGYMAVPLALAAKACDVPVVTHEGTSVVGRANRLLFRVADRVLHSFPELYNFDLNKLRQEVVLTGTPIRKKLLNPVSPSRPDWLKLKNQNNKILLVLGGSQGSLTINHLIKDSLVSLTKDWTVIHQCGRPNKLYHYKKELEDYAAQMNINPQSYFVREWIDESELPWIYSNAQVAISRAGANTLEELRLYKLPSILVPLPHSYASEQELNAKFMADHHAAVIIKQEQASINTLLNELKLIITDREEIQSNLGRLPLPDPRLASSKIFTQLKAVS